MRYCSDVVSRKIRILSFLATISVVIIHTNALEGNQEMPSAWWIGNLIGYAQRWAVPSFFVVSGFFIHRTFTYRYEFSFLRFLKKRIETLLVPYLIWGAVYGAITMTPLSYFVAMAHHENAPWSHTVFTGNIMQVIDRVIGISRQPPQRCFVVS